MCGTNNTAGKNTTHHICVKKQICCLHGSCRLEVHDSISINTNVADPTNQNIGRYTICKKPNGT
jgi:hypothetical protein